MVIANHKPPGIALKAAARSHNRRVALGVARYTPALRPGATGTSSRALRPRRSRREAPRRARGVLARKPRFQGPRRWPGPAGTPRGHRPVRCHLVEPVRHVLDGHDDGRLPVVPVDEEQPEGAVAKCRPDQGLDTASDVVGEQGRGVVRRRVRVMTESIAAEAVAWARLEELPPRRPGGAHAVARTRHGEGTDAGRVPAATTHGRCGQAPRRTRPLIGLRVNPQFLHGKP